MLSQTDLRSSQRQSRTTSLGCHDYLCRFAVPIQINEKLLHESVECKTSVQVVLCFHDNSFKTEWKNEYMANKMSAVHSNILSLLGEQVQAAKAMQSSLTKI